VFNNKATCAAKMEIANDGKVTVTEEVDGGVQTVSSKLPMIITADLRLISTSTILTLDLMSLDTSLYQPL
jgi:electron transfer flavoprotein alpha/beta subunit